MVRRHPRVTQLPLTSQILVLVLPFVFPLFAIVFGIACWTSFKAKPSARVWGIIASLINIQTALFPLLLPPHSFWNAFLPILGIGIAGVVAFARQVEPAATASEIHESPAIQGDGTNNIVNQAIPLVVLCGGGAAFWWWLKWIRMKEIFIPHSSSYLIIVCMLLGMLIVTFHEFGHAAVGMALGMKLRALMVGPFYWRIRDGKWEFQFEPLQIFAERGATGVVPARRDFPRLSYLCMLLGGIFVNSVTGIIALLLGSTAEPDSPLQAGGFLVLFGAWSLLSALLNLIPFRTQHNYSDGAQIRQQLSNGPWADLHRVFNVAGASLVTQLRPRDYDAEAILRAGHTINQGAQGLILRLLAYSYFLDQEKVLEAAEALREAGLIYERSASEVPAELLTAFIFGSAYLDHDANTARQWWTRMEAKKKVRFDVDYWLAASALQWVEGKHQEAMKAWEKANSLAQQLPRFGGYEFERDRCSMLRRALDEVPVTHR
jgi:hypothetical protein